MPKTPHPSVHFPPGAKVHELLKPPGEYFTLRDIQEVCATCGAPGLSPTQVLTVLFSPRAWHNTNPQCSSSLTASLPRESGSHWRGWASCATGQCSWGPQQGWAAGGCGAELWSPSRHGCLLLVDAVASLGGVPILMDQQGESRGASEEQGSLSAPTPAPVVCALRFPLAVGQSPAQSPWSLSCRD